MLQVFLVHPDRMPKREVVFFPSVNPCEIGLYMPQSWKFGKLNSF